MLASLGQISVREMLNPKSAGFKKMGLALDRINNREAARLIEENPRIMRRPLLSDGKGLVVGFDPEGYLRMTG